MRKNYYLRAALLLVLALPIATLSPAQELPKITLPPEPVVPKPITIEKSTSKVSEILLDLQQEYGARNSQRNGRSGTFTPSSTMPVQVYGGYVVVDITAKESADALKAEMEALGMQQIAVYGRVISGMFPVDALQQLNGVQGIRYAQPALKPLTNVGVVTSQGDSAQLSNVARARFGVDGLGVKVGVLSDSYNNLNGAADGIASGDLPGLGNPNGRQKPVQVLLDLAAGGSDEGRAMLEIVHDVAPGADLAFHTAFTGVAGFAQGILALADTGCDVIVDDIIYFNEPFFQDGIIAQAIDEVKSQGKIYFSSAGDKSLRSYESSYRATTEEILGSGAGTAHNFSDLTSPAQYLQPILLPGGGTFTCSFQWDQPFFSASTSGVGATTDMNIYLLNQAGQVVAQGAADNITITGDPIELFSYRNPKPATASAIEDVVFYLAILKAAGPDPARLKYMLYGDGNFYQTAVPIPGINSPTLVGHANAAGAIATGAAFYRRTPVFGAETAMVNGFSSVGGVPILFEATGARKAAPEVRLKPNITAPNGANTSFFPTNAGADFEGDGFPNFFGTSAAASHAAATAALMLEASRTSLTFEQVNNALQGTSLDMDNPYTAGFDVDFDFATGFGFIQADKAVEAVAFTPAAVLNLNLTSVCSDDPATKRRWRIRNPNAFPVGFTWEVYDTDQQGKLIAPPGDSFFFTETIEGPNTTIIAWQNETGEVKRNVKASSGAACSSARIARDATGDDTNEFTLVTAFPNPTRDKLTLLFLDEGQTDLSIKLYNTKGEEVYKETAVTAEDNPEVAVDVSQLPSGLYMLRVGKGHRQQTLKVLVQNR